MKPSCNILYSFGINGSLRRREEQSPNSYTEHYLFNSAANLKAYSYDRTDFAYYGYNASNTRAYKLSMLNMHQWVNGQPQPLNLQLQSAMFYPNAYINFNHNGEYTKHYYNGSERIASRLGDMTAYIYAEAGERLENRIMRQDALFRSQIGELVSYEEPPAPAIPADRSGGTRELVSPPVEYEPFLSIPSLQPTGTPDDIFYYHTNHLGSTAFVTDQNQNVTQGFLYAPFGEITTEYAPLWQNGTLPKYSFNAKELDEETGMYYYEARYYKPPVFTSRDPMFEKYFWMTPYAYCANNPVKYVDPSGREFVDNEGNRVRVRVLKNGNIQYKFSRKTSETAKSDFISNHSESLSALSKTKQGRKCISFLNRCYTSVYINPTNESGNQNSLVIPSCDENNYVKMNNGVYENVEIKPFMGSIRNKANQDNVDVDEILGATLIVEAGHLKKVKFQEIITRNYQKKANIIVCITSMLIIGTIIEKN